jgi:ribosomal subunit interface protein
MTLTVTGKQVNITASTREQIARKLRRIGRRLNDSIVSVQCVLTVERQQAVCEMTLHARGDHMLHGIGRHTAMRGAIAAAFVKVEHQAQKLADKWKTRRKDRLPVTRPSRPAPAEPAAPARRRRTRG